MQLPNNVRSILIEPLLLTAFSTLLFKFDFGNEYDFNCFYY